MTTLNIIPEHSVHVKYFPSSTYDFVTVAKIGVNWTSVLNLNWIMQKSLDETSCENAYRSRDSYPFAN
jgi:hypothetical protein